MQTSWLELGTLPLLQFFASDQLPPLVFVHSMQAAADAEPAPTLSSASVASSAAAIRCGYRQAPVPARRAGLPLTRARRVLSGIPAPLTVEPPIDRYERRSPPRTPKPTRTAAHGADSRTPQGTSLPGPARLVNPASLILQSSHEPRGAVQRAQHLRVAVPE